MTYQSRRHGNEGLQQYKSLDRELFLIKTETDGNVLLGASKASCF
jgi:hypothetical protein